jgi:hypothetical protein
LLAPVAAFEITAPPYECPTARTRPGTWSNTLATYALSLEMPRSGLAAAITWMPCAWRRSMTPAQLELSAKAPCTSTTVSGEVFVV